MDGPTLRYWRGARPLLAPHFLGPCIFLFFFYPLAPTYLCDELRRPADTEALADDDYVLPHQRLWMFDVLVCPLPVTERFLSQPLICGTVFHHTSLLPLLSLHLLLSS